ncbi:MarR family transcriptional regulator [Bacillus salipaludis]|uniref:MarR family transcriptional regulator n=1 Tax=Bacillus salipaludis TaxID=2547811 RepID=A0A4R5VJ82_9BACI|nr:MarR family transcriptional regulator [Bacillus salipaludis]
MSQEIFGEFLLSIIKMSGVLGGDKSFVEGLTPKQLHLLMEIGSNTYRHGDLAGILGVDPSTLTRTLDPLVKSGLVERQHNLDNRREVLIKLTGKGLETVANAHEKHHQLFADILKQVPENKRKQVDESLSILLEIIKKTNVKH